MTYMQSDFIYALLISGRDALFSVEQVLGSVIPGAEKSDQLRQYYGKDRIHNGFYSSTDYFEACTDIQQLFPGIAIVPSLVEGVGEIERLSPSQFHSTVTKSQSVANQTDLIMLVISPTALINSDHVYIIEDLIKSKYTVCETSIQKLTRQDIDFLFEDQRRFLILDILEKEFQKGESMLIVLEKEYALTDIHKLIGKFEIKSQ